MILLITNQIMGIMRTYKNIKDTYKLYNSLSSNPVEKKDYIDICSLYNRFIIRKVLQGIIIRLPSKMGTLCITGKKQKIRRDESGNIVSLAPNWRKTMEYWKNNEEAKKNKKIIYCTNEHSNGVRYKYFWSKKNVVVPFKNLYSFRLVRENKRAVRSAILEGHEFLIIDRAR